MMVMMLNALRLLARVFGLWPRFNLVQFLWVGCLLCLLLLRLAKLLHLWRH